MDFDFDSLYCNEEDLDCDIGSQNGFDDYNQNVGNLTGSGDEFLSLFSKEKEPFLGYNELISNGFTRDYRKIAVERILGVVSYDGFSVLAMNYFDRYISSVCFQREKPWMTRLLAIACLSLAAEVEETHVPLLWDLQVGESKYIFEAKTIMKMELMVLYALEWKMHPVTPLLFFNWRLQMNTHLRSWFLGRCEHILLSAITGQSRRYL